MDLRSELRLPQNRRVESCRAKTAGEGKGFEELVMEESKLPINWEWGFRIIKVGAVGLHVEPNFQFRRLVRIWNHCRGQSFNLRNHNLARRHNPNYFFLGYATPFLNIRPDAHDFYVCRIFGGKLVGCRRTRFSSSDKPTVIISRKNELIVTIQDFVQIESFLVSLRIRVSSL